MQNILKQIISERRQSEKATCCVIPAIQHSRKGKAMETVNGSVIAREEEEGISGAQGNVRTVKISCMTS